MASSGRVRCGRAITRAGLAALALTLAMGRGGPVAADTVILKDGTTYRGTVDRDNTLMFVSDNLKRTIFYNSKVARVESGDDFNNLTRFQLVQPLEVHAGVMPPAAVDIVATPWDAKGRRSFQYKNNRLARVAMQQAINEISPHSIRYRGIDGFWVGQVATSEVPRPVILGLLAKVEQANEDERVRVARFLIQARWFDEAKAALGALEHDFPHLKDTVADVRRSVVESEARDALIDAAAARRAQQPAASLRILRGVVDPALPREILDEARELIRQADEQAAADRATADRLRALGEGLGESARAAWRGRVAEVLAAIAQAPDVGRARVEPTLRPESPGEAAVPPETRFARGDVGLGRRAGRGRRHPGRGRRALGGPPGDAELPHRPDPAAPAATRRRKPSRPRRRPKTPPASAPRPWRGSSRSRPRTTSRPRRSTGSSRGWPRRSTRTEATTGGRPPSIASPTTRTRRPPSTPSSSRRSTTRSGPTRRSSRSTTAADRARRSTGSPPRPRGGATW